MHTEIFFFTHSLYSSLFLNQILTKPPEKISLHYVFYKKQKTSQENFARHRWELKLYEKLMNDVVNMLSRERSDTWRKEIFDALFFLSKGKEALWKSLPSPANFEETIVLCIA
jgi:hypothetical protein